MVRASLVDTYFGQEFVHAAYVRLRPRSHLRLLRVGEFRGATNVLPARFRPAPAFRRAGQVALHVGEAAEDGHHQPPGADGHPCDYDASLKVPSGWTTTVQAHAR